MMRTQFTFQGRPHERLSNFDRCLQTPDRRILYAIYKLGLIRHFQLRFAHSN